MLIEYRPPKVLPTKRQLEAKAILSGLNKVTGQASTETD